MVPRPGHITMGTSPTGNVLRIWPSPDPTRWHVGYAGFPPRATEEPVTAEEILPLLAAWAFEAETWASWACPPHESNPDLDRVRRHQGR